MTYILSQMPYIVNEKRDYAILMLFLNCGIRRSELVNLNISDVYEDRIRVVGKGNKERFVYFGSACRKAIDAYMQIRSKQILTDNRALFGSRNGNRISTDAVHRLVKKALLQAGLDATQFSAHKLRHTAATMMLSGGVDVKTVQEVTAKKDYYIKKLDKLSLETEHEKRRIADILHLYNNFNFHPLYLRMEQLQTMAREELEQVIQKEDSNNPSIVSKLTQYKEKLEKKQDLHKSKPYPPWGFSPYIRGAVK